MSYLGFVKSICTHHMSGHSFPKVLEIGVHYGQTALPLVQNLSSRFEKFLYTGVDIMVRPEVVQQFLQFEGVSVAGVDDTSGKDVVLLEENSLSWLKKIQRRSTKFDVVFLDGDHNYTTVLSELNLLQNLIKPTTIIVCDDYSGRWAERDLFYSEREEYKSVEIATPRIDAEKQGVRNAVNDFVNSTPVDWTGFCLPSLEPIVLYRADVYRQVNYRGSIRGSKQGLMRDFRFPLKSLNDTASP